MGLGNLFYNPDLDWSGNTVIFWCWESIIHHLYFIVLFVQRQFSETWESGELWRLNMEKECGFFANLFGGDARLCADSTMTLFSGIWFETPNPTGKQKNWIGRMVTNYQHSEATIHFLICIFGLIVVFKLAGVSKAKKNSPLSDGVSATPAWLRWALFLVLFLETWIMCVPYLFLFGWAWVGVIPPKNPIVDTMASFGSEPYMDGIQMGASLITMFWVSVVVLILDAWAMFRTWQFAMGNKDNFLLNTFIFGGSTAAFTYYAMDFFSEGGRGMAGEATLATRTLDALHGLFGGDHTSMVDIASNK